MPVSLPHTTVRLRPTRRTAMLPVREAVRQSCPAVLQQPQVAYCAHHTTAGFLDASARSQMGSKAEAVRPFVAAYRALFPHGAGYQHDQMHLRTELPPEQRRCEPRNADAHLAYMGAGLVACTCTTPQEALALVDLDGVNRETGRQRTRRVTAVGFASMHDVASFTVNVPAPPRAVGAVSLRDPRLGLMVRIQAVLSRHAVSWGCVELALEGAEPEAAEPEAALVVNEYETQLMRHDVARMLRAPRYFQTAAQVAAAASPNTDFYGTQAPVSTPAMPKPAPELRMHPAIRLLVQPADNGTSRLVQGRYQSPILLHRKSKAYAVRVTVARCA